MQQLEGNVLAPTIVGRAVSLHPAVVLVAVGIGATLWGILGAFVAVPVTAIAMVLVDYYTARPADGRRRRAGAVTATSTSTPTEPAGPSEPLAPD